MNDSHEFKKILANILAEQIRLNKPPETKKTYERLLKTGLTVEQAKEMIEICISLEIYDVLKTKKPYNNERYVNHLMQLPKLPDEVL